MSTLAERNTLGWLIPGALACALAGGNAVALAAGPQAGAICLAIALLGLLNVYVLMPQNAVSPLLLPLSLVALLQLMSLALAPAYVSATLLGALVGALSLLALRLAVQIEPVDSTLLRLRRRDLPGQFLIAAGGIPLGIAGELILRPQPLAALQHPAGAAVAAVVLAVLVAPSLELLFRWSLQTEILTLYGGAGLALVNVLFASLYLGTRSPGFVLFMGLTGLGLSVAVRRTNSVWGAVAAHAILIIGVLILWPAVLR
jgi:membrane protease YdiL (CAAX protease family)